MPSKTKGVFVWDYFSKKSLFLSKKSVFVCLDNFLKIIRLLKGKEKIKEKTKTEIK